jgi:hypothetical protein
MTSIGMRSPMADLFHVVGEWASDTDARVGSRVRRVGLLGDAHPRLVESQSPAVAGADGCAAASLRESASAADVRACDCSFSMGPASSRHPHPPGSPRGRLPDVGLPSTREVALRDHRGPAVLVDLALEPKPDTPRHWVGDRTSPLQGRAARFVNRRILLRVLRTRTTLREARHTARLVGHEVESEAEHVLRRGRTTSGRVRRQPRARTSSAAGGDAGVADPNPSPEGRSASSE